MVLAWVITWAFRVQVDTPQAEIMAFIRKRGDFFYLVHNVRKKGRVRQLQLASLGRRPRISDEVVQSIITKHPFLQVDWASLRQRASHDLVQPMLNDSEYLRTLLYEIRKVHLEIADFQWPVLEVLRDRELRTKFATELKLLRGTLEVKLGQLRKGRFADFAL
jgi:hypothetical protein